jgi:hypothetical protein
MIHERYHNIIMYFKSYLIFVDLILTETSHGLLNTAEYTINLHNT